MNKPNVDKFLCEQINKNEYKVLKEFSLSKLNVRYKASLTEHVYDEETATFLSKAFLFSNTKDLLEKKFWIVMITKSNLETPIYINVALTDDKESWGAVASYERAVAIVKLMCEYSLTKIKEDLDNKSDIFNTYFLN